MMSFQYFFYAFNFNHPHLFPSAPKTITSCMKNKHIHRCPFTSQGDRCKDVVSHHWNQRSAVVQWMHRHIKLMLQKYICMHLPLSDHSAPWGTQHPPLLASTARVERKCSSWVIPQHNVQLQAHMHRKARHLSFTWMLESKQPVLRSVSRFGFPVI